MIGSLRLRAGATSFLHCSSSARDPSFRICGEHLPVAKAAGDVAGYRSCRRTRRVLKLRDPLSGSTSAGAIGRGRPSMHSKDADSDASSLDCASQAAERCDDSASREQGLASQTLSNTADR